MQARLDHPSVKPHIAEHQTRSTATGAAHEKNRKLRVVAKAEAEQERSVFKMNLANNRDATIVRGLGDRMHLHCKEVASIFDAHAIIVNALCVCCGHSDDYGFVRVVAEVCNVWHGKCLSVRFGAIFERAERSFTAFDAIVHQVQAVG